MPRPKWLLDTNVLLTALIDPKMLPEDTETLLQDRKNTIYFSAASIWEIAIKYSLGHKSFDFKPQDIHRLATETGFTELPIESMHCYPLTQMVWHHRDPFDRLLVAAGKIHSSLHTNHRCCFAALLPQIGKDDSFEVPALSLVVTPIRRSPELICLFPAQLRKWIKFSEVWC